MQEAQLIEKAIKKIPRGKIFLSESIYKKYPVKIVQRVLLRLVKSNEIGTICRGMYFRPRKSHYFPDVPISPTADDIVSAISKKTGEIISVHGAVALNQLGLSTQIPARHIYYTSGRTRYIKINGKNSIKLTHINAKNIVMPNTVTCQVVAALCFEGKRYLKPRVIKKIHDRTGDEHFNKVLMHVDKMPTWIRKVFVRYQNMRLDDPELEEEFDSYYQGN